MLKQMSTKKIIIAFGAAVLVIAAAVVILVSNNINKNEVFRSIMVYELEGNALIERVDIGTIDATENLYLESGDRVRVSEASLMRLKVDNDKYIMAEANTVFTLEAEGDEQDSRTKINLEKGAITNEIQNPLSSESVYETATPNAVMAVRGTVYRVELYDNGEEDPDTRLCCFRGAVATMPVLSDGTRGEEVLVAAGSEITIYNDGTVSELTNIDYDTLSEQALETINRLNIEITENTVQNESSETAEGTGNTDGSEANETAEEGSQQEERKEIVSTDSSNRKNDNKQTDIAKKDNDVQIGTESVKNSEKTVESKEQQKSESNASASGSESDTSGNGNNNSGSGNSNSSSGNSNSSSGNSNSSSGNSNSGNGNNSSGDGNSSSGGDNSGNTGSGQKPADKPGEKPDEKPDQPPAAVNYTVTFRYNGSIFATQIVMQGKKAEEPVLVPEMTGEWDFDFDMPITADTVIEWITVE